MRFRQAHSDSARRIWNRIPGFGIRVPDLGVPAKAGLPNAAKCLCQRLAMAMTATQPPKQKIKLAADKASARSARVRKDASLPRASMELQTTPAIRLPPKGNNITSDSKFKNNAMSVVAAGAKSTTKKHAQFIFSRGSSGELNGNSGGCGLAEFNCADFMPERASVKPFRPACRNCAASPALTGLYAGYPRAAGYHGAHVRSHPIAQRH